MGEFFCKVFCCLFVDPVFVVSVCNDLLDIIEDCDGEIHMYADDTTIFTWLRLLLISREDKGDREGIPHTHPIP